MCLKFISNKYASDEIKLYLMIERDIIRSVFQVLNTIYDARLAQMAINLLSKVVWLIYTQEFRWIEEEHSLLQTEEC